MAYMEKEFAALGPERFAGERLGKTEWPSGEPGEWETMSEEAWAACYAEGVSLAGPAGWWTMPETGWTGEPPEPDPPYDPEWVHAIHDALIHWEPRMFAEVLTLAEGHETELRAAIGADGRLPERPDGHVQTGFRAVR